MFTMKRVLATLILAACTAGGAVTAQAATDLTTRMELGNNTAALAAQAALGQLSASLAAEEGSLPAGFPLEVTDVQDLRRATIGFGYEEFTADPAALMAGDSLEKAARPSGTWRYTVLVDGQPVGMMSMAYVGGKWEVASIGAARLANEVNDAVAQMQKGQSLRVIRVPQATSDFVEIKGAGQKAKFVPLDAARRSLDIQQALVTKQGQAVDESAFAASLRDTVSRNLTQ
ncbi:hypothetical protein [Tahibacter amnicola]|uniref:Uncharacterized protein n=1 Tax=Tahibacter amnicola TaxID=2976241 RepID=A0ABY6BDH0_9GAMM|nr:hypothetical protein [Tahibacter amnicola]UXI68074.1 hypothetical protein N4264_00015 [Tahibacter amnicola]